MRKNWFIFPIMAGLFFSCSSPKNDKAAWNDPAYKELLKLYDLKKQQAILQAARESIFRFWDDGEMPAVPPLGPNEGLAIRLISRGKDRGCISWYKNVGDPMLFAAYCAAMALRDPRYAAVTQDEAENILVELSIFGEWEDMAGPEEFIPGFHSIWLIDGPENTLLQAALVPQRSYTKEAFLELLCKKAGLDRNAWKEDKTLQWRRSPGLWYIEPLLP